MLDADGDGGGFGQTRQRNQLSAAFELTLKAHLF